MKWEGGIEMRIVNDPYEGRIEREMIPFTFNGIRYEARDGESIAAALLANGVRTLRHDRATGEPRGLYCGIGHCYECRVDIVAEDGSHQRVRACITAVTPDMCVESVDRSGGGVDGAD